VTLQEAAIDPAMTGAEHLELVAGLWGLRRSQAAVRAHELLVTFGLAAVADDRIRSYSGGMQRRLDIAAALVTRPAVLFLDEPTTGLDPQSRRALWSEIQRHQGEGVTVFLTTQYLDEADELASRIAIIDAGTIIAEGTPSQLKRTHGRTTLTLEVDGPADRVFAALNGSRSDARPEPARDGRMALSLPSETGGAGVLAALDAIRGAGVEPRHVGVTEASLEDVYLRLTGTAITGDAASAEPGVGISG
jgi:ABC-type multidrug transport system ATPase subunit